MKDNDTIAKYLQGERVDDFNSWTQDKKASFGKGDEIDIIQLENYQMYWGQVFGQESTEHYVFHESSMLLPGDDGVDVKNKKLHGIDFSQIAMCNLFSPPRFADFTGTEFSDPDSDKAKESRPTNWSEARFAGATLNNITAHYMQGSGVEFQKTKLNNAKLLYADLRKARVSKETELKGADLRHADLRGAVALFTLTKQNIEGINLKGVYLDSQLIKDLAGRNEGTGCAFLDKWKESNPEAWKAYQEGKEHYLIKEDVRSSLDRENDKKQRGSENSNLKNSKKYLTPDKKEQEPPAEKVKQEPPAKTETQEPSKSKPESESEPKEEPAAASETEEWEPSKPEEEPPIAFQNNPKTNLVGFVAAGAAAFLAFISGRKKEPKPGHDPEETNKGRGWKMVAGLALTGLAGWTGYRAATLPNDQGKRWVDKVKNTDVAAGKQPSQQR